MSEEILRALMQLFAIIAKQDGGVESSEIEYVNNFLTQQLNSELVSEYYALFEQRAGILEEEKIRLTSVKDSVKILGISKKINKTLTQSQKIVVLVRLFELVNADRKFTDQRMAIINTVAEVFNVSKEEFTAIESFVIQNNLQELQDPNLLIINSTGTHDVNCKYVSTEQLDKDIIILRVKSVDLYFLKYTGSESLFLNGLAIGSRRIYLFANGSTIKLPKGKPIYYSDIAAHYLADTSASKISFQVKELEFRFPNGNIGVRDINFNETHGRLIGIMGASGAGKTTLLNVLCGIEKPSKGEVLINGINLHKEKEKIEGVIGLIPQDDLLIEELTVFQNLYYSAKLCFKNKTEEELTHLVHKTLNSLGLFDRKDLKVGSPLNKMISGGQRKRLNIALELIREPSILFVDEPTSGLSSRDSENVMDLLRELTLKGKLIFVVIHQPSSEIYKMFDKMVILDTGGYLIFYGNPVEAVMYFKRMDNQINSEVGECPTCGNVNPELIFNIIETRVVDEFGNYTQKRRVLPTEWEAKYLEAFNVEDIPEINEEPPRTLSIPSWLKQLRIYLTRDFLSKIANSQYVALTMLEAPILGFILAFIIRYIADPNSNEYIFRENENIPIYIFMALIVSLFLGLTVSAEEIFRDRKILKREGFLNLSRSSYLISKVVILFTISALQSILFVLIANSILGLKGMTFTYWLALFSTAAFANMLGLNVSASFNSAITIYILIPLLMIPMMILSGAMFRFDKMNRKVGSVDKVPFLAELMVTKWSYEALMVHQFKDNVFEREFYEFEKQESVADFMKVYVLPELEKKLSDVFEEFRKEGKIEKTAGDLLLLKNEIASQMAKNPHIPFNNLEQINPIDFSARINRSIVNYLNLLNQHYGNLFQLAYTKREKKKELYLAKNENAFNRAKDNYYNEAVADQLKNIYEKNKLLEYKNRLVPQVDPIYRDPEPENRFSIRSHYLAPRKHFMGNYYDTFWFNMVIIWIMTSVLYITLYYEHLKKFLDLTGKIKFKK
jgi:ABC transport system ATP-binding/permease protein